jgi:hypothetical protein
MSKKLKVCLEYTKWAGDGGIGRQGSVDKSKGLNFM